MSRWRPLFPALVALSGCGTPSPHAAPPLHDEVSESRRKKDEEIVALHDGRPLTWRAVAEHALANDFRAAVDRCVRSRIVEERRAALGIVNTPADLRRRADSLVRAALEGSSAEAFRARIAGDGFTEETYREHLAGSRYLDEALGLERVVRTEALRRGTMEIDRMVFANAGDAEKFASQCAEKGYDAAADAFTGAARVTRRPRETLLLGAPPDPQSPAPDVLSGLKPGEVSRVLADRGESFSVIRLRALNPGQSLPPDDERTRVLEGILREPPSAAEIRRWIDAEFSRSRIEYADPTPRAGKPR
jgi:hypothetical protein